MVAGSLAGLAAVHVCWAEVRAFPPGGKLRFEIRDRLDHRLYRWPRTLLTYPVRFDAANVGPEQLRLACGPGGPLAETGEAVPFQL